MNKKKVTAKPRAQAKRVPRKAAVVREQAAKVAAFVNDLTLPEFLTEPVLDRLNEAAHANNFKFSGDQSKYVDELGQLLALTPSRFTPDKADSARELAELISKVLMHPATPVCIYNALADGISDLYISRKFIDGPVYIEAALRHHFEEGGAR